MFFPDAPAIERSVPVRRTRDAVETAAARVETDWEDALNDIDVLYKLGPNQVQVKSTVRALERDVQRLVSVIKRSDDEES